MLTFTLCEKCGKHGRFVWTPDARRGRVSSLKPWVRPVEVASKDTAGEILEAAVFHGVIDGEHEFALSRLVMNSDLAGTESQLDETFREHIEMWNEAASTTNRPDLFAQSDFHAYIKMIEAPTLPSHDTPRFIN